MGSWWTGEDVNPGVSTSVGTKRHWDSLTPEEWEKRTEHFEEKEGTTV